MSAKLGHKLKRIGVAFAAALVTFVPVGASAEAGFGAGFVGQFTEACVPERLSFAGTVDHAKTLGWAEVAPSVHPELDAVMQKARAVENDPDFEDATAEFAVLGTGADSNRFLVVTRVSMPEIITLIGCYLYAFDAVEPIDPALVTAMLEHPLAYSTDKPGDYAVDPALLTSHVWGPAKKLPRTFDTYLTFIPEGSTAREQTGFTGLVLKFETSEPDETATE